MVAGLVSGQKRRVNRSPHRRIPQGSLGSLETALPELVGEPRITGGCSALSLRTHPLNSLAPRNQLDILPEASFLGIAVFVRNCLYCGWLRRMGIDEHPCCYTRDSYQDHSNLASQPWAPSQKLLAQVEPLPEVDSQSPFQPDACCGWNSPTPVRLPETAPASL